MQNGSRVIGRQMRGQGAGHRGNLQGIGIEGQIVLRRTRMRNDVYVEEKHAT